MSTTNLGSRVLGAGRASERLDAGERGGARRRLRVTGWRRVISPIALLVIWQLTHVFDLVSDTKLPPPTQVVSEAWTLITTDSPAYGTLQGALVASMERMAVGFAVGAAFALLLAVVAGLSRRGEETVDPLMQMVRTLPLFGLVPVFIVWFGIGQLPKILLIAIGAAVPLYLNTFSGIRGVDGRLGEPPAARAPRARARAGPAAARVRAPACRPRRRPPPSQAPRPRARRSSSATRRARARRRCSRRRASSTASASRSSSPISRPGRRPCRR